MERGVKEQAAAATPPRNLLPSQNYGSPLTKGLFTCAAFMTFAFISLITVSTPKGPFAPSTIRNPFGMLHAPHPLVDQGTLPPPVPYASHPIVDQGTLPPPVPYDVDDGNLLEYERKIKEVFERASMPNRTVILTTLNEAWAKEGTMINLFVESFWNGYGTQRLLQHLIFICIDQKAYDRCLAIHPHCIKINTHNVSLSEEQFFLSTNYIKLVWRRIKFLKTVLSLNFDFILTDTDLLWLRDPISILQANAKADIQVSSDYYNKKPWDIHNAPNTGFMYVRANERTIKFFTFWYEERNRNSNLATQGIFNIIKHSETFKNIGLKLYFLDPQFFGGFCGFKLTDMTKSITMHATCCKGLDAKLIDLKKAFGEWKKWQQFYTLETTDLKDLKLKSSPINQTSMQPCDVKRFGISPEFPKPLSCMHSFDRNTRLKVSH